jgi:hypothetical protein
MVQIIATMSNLPLPMISSFLRSYQKEHALLPRSRRKRKARFMCCRRRRMIDASKLADQNRTLNFFNR